MLGFGPFCLDLGHIAWIWAIWQNLGQNRPQRRWSPEDGAGGTYVWTYGRTDVRTDGRTDGQIPPVFYRTSSPSGPLPKKYIKRLFSHFSTRWPWRTDGRTNGRTNGQTKPLIELHFATKNLPITLKTDFWYKHWTFFTDLLFVLTLFSMFALDAFICKLFCKSRKSL